MMNMDEIIREAEKDPETNRKAKEIANNMIIKERACKVLNIEMKDKVATKFCKKPIENCVDDIIEEFVSIFGNVFIFRFTECGLPVEYINFEYNNADNFDLAVIGNHYFDEPAPIDNDMRLLLCYGLFDGECHLANVVVDALKAHGFEVPESYMDNVFRHGLYYYWKVVLAMRYILEKYKKQQKVTANPSNIEIPDVKFIYPSDGNVPFQNNVIKFVAGGTR